MAGWPDATNTGVPSGLKLLPSGDVVVTKAGTIISGLDIKGTVYIAADNVTIENCKITSNSFSAVQIKQGVSGAVVQDCTIDGVGTNNEGSSGITGAGTFLRNNIYNVENGLNIGPGKGTVIEGNYIHDLKASGSPHYDGIQIDGGQTDTIVRHNTVINDHTQTAALMIDNYFGPVTNILVTDNLLVGGGYTIYSDGQFNGGKMTGITITNNHVGGGHWGDLNANSTSPTYTGNVRDGLALVETLNTSDAPSVTPPPVTPPATNPGTPPASNSATESADRLTGDAKDNVIDGKGGNDTINGGAGNDTIIGGLGYDILTGGAGKDTFLFRSPAEIGDRPGARDVISDFKQGEDKIDLSAIDANTKLAGQQAFTFIEGNDGSFTKTAGEIAWRTDAASNRTIVQGDLDGDGKHDFELELTGTVSLKASDFIGIGAASKPSVPGNGGTVTPPTTTPPVENASKTLAGTASADRITGTSADEFLDGKAGNDTLNGGGGNDVIYGGMGRDIMTGGAGNDSFLFKSAAETGSTVRTRDVITDFKPGQDKIDLSAIDANTRISGDQAFTFLSGDNQSFSHKAGELAWRTEAAQNRTIVQGDVNGDGIHDFEIELTGQIHLGQGDIIL